MFYNKQYTFDDVLIEPTFSFVGTRKACDTTVDFSKLTTLSVPVISSNMDTVTGSKLASTMLQNGAQGCLHRFCSVEENTKMFTESLVQIEEDCIIRPWVSVGIGNTELRRAEALYGSGAQTFLLDVANGANIDVVKQVKDLQDWLKGYGEIIVGNFANKKSIEDFIYHLGNKNVQGFKVGIGGGSACTTRVVTGIGVPTLSSVSDCVTSGYPIIADGGIRNSGDVCKAIAAGAKAVMLGRMFAGTTESLAAPVYGAAEEGELLFNKPITHKKYSGSASAESYEVQGKIATWRTPEGESFLVPYTGSATEVLQKLQAGLKSSMAYVDARTIEEFQKKAKFVFISNNSVKENAAHGKS